MEHKNVNKLMILIEEKLTKLSHDDVKLIKIFFNLNYFF